MIPQFEPLFSSDEQSHMAEYLKSGGFLTEFKKTTEFCNVLCSITKAKNSICVNNGTISLSIAYKALELQPGDKILVPNFTMFATASSAWFVGLEVWFCDVRSADLLMDLDQAVEILDESFRAVVITNANGRTHSSEEFKKLQIHCEKNNVKIIEDAAQALGSWYDDGTHAGLKGNLGSLSFSVPKIITTGQGGALITGSDVLANKIKKIKDFGRATGGNDVHEELGINSKFTDLQAVIGITQLKNFQWRVDRKKEIFGKYKEGLKQSNYGYLIDCDLDYCTPWFYEFICEDKAEVKRRLNAANIGFRDMYPQLNKQKAFEQHFQYGETFSVSKNIDQHGLWLPSSLALTNDQIEYICKEL